MTARFLVIDDMRVVKPARLEEWKPGSYEIVYARTSDEGLKALKDEDGWDVIHLDHDLGGMDTVKPCLDYVLEFPEKFTEVSFFVHTGNPYEKRSIHQQLEVRGLFSVMVEASEFFDNDYELWAKANGLI